MSKQKNIQQPYFKADSKYFARNEQNILRNTVLKDDLKNKLLLILNGSYSEKNEYFTVEEKYFNELAEILSKKVFSTNEFATVLKQNVFVADEEYFDTLTSKIGQRIHTKSSKLFYPEWTEALKWNPSLVFAMSILVLLLVGLGIYTLNNDSKWQEEAQLLSKSDIIEYVADAVALEDIAMANIGNQWADELNNINISKQEILAEELTDEL